MVDLPFAAIIVQVRKPSVIQPPSETVVTQNWIENAVKSHEQEEEVEIVEMQFEAIDGENYYEAEIRAKIPGKGPAKKYHWIIKENPSLEINYDPNEKHTFIVTNLGCKLSNFVAKKKLKKPPAIPFRPVIYADSQYAIFDDMKNYKQFTDDTGFDLPHMKQSLRGVARLHALSYAYFNKSGDDVMEFSEVLKVMIDRHYQPSAGPDDRKRKAAELEASLDVLLNLLRSVDKEGAKIADESKAKFGGKLYPLFKNANASSSKFSVLCHGSLSSKHIHFLYNSDRTPTDVKFTGFHNALYANAAVDLQHLFATAMGPKIEEQSEFLLRFVYYETLAGVMKMFDFDATKIIPYETLFSDFKDKRLYGCLAGSMFLAEEYGPKHSKLSGPRRGEKRVFKSKLIGQTVGNTDPETYKSAAPSLRAKTLMEKAVKI